MFCSQCGAQLPEGAAFCGECGAQVASSSTPEETPVAPEASASPEPPVTDETPVAPEASASSEPPVADETPQPPVEGEQQLAVERVASQQSAGPFDEPEYVAAQPIDPTVGAAMPDPVYDISESDRTLRLVAFVFCVISCVSVCWLVIPLAWMIPMTVHCWKLYKGEKANTVAFGVCTLLFLDIVSGILLLVSTKEEG